MAEVNANIPLSTIAPPIMQPGQQLQLMEIARQMKLRNDVQNLMRTPGAIDENGLPKTQTLIALRQIDQGMGDAATMHRAQALEMQSLERKRVAEEQAVIEKQREDHVVNNIMAPSLAAAYAASGGPEMQAKAMRDSIQAKYAELKRTGMADKLQMGDPRFLDAMLAHSVDDVASELIARGKGDVIERGAAMGEARRNSQAQQQTGQAPQAGRVIQGGEPPAQPLTMAGAEQDPNATPKMTPQPGDTGADYFNQNFIGPKGWTEPQTNQPPVAAGDPNAFQESGVTGMAQELPEKQMTETYPPDSVEGLRKQAKQNEDKAERLRANGAVKEAERADNKAKDLRTASRELEQRIQKERDQDRQDKQAEKQSMTPFMKEAGELYGVGTPKYKAALADHIKKMDALPQWLAQAPAPMTADQAKLTGEDFLATLSPGEQATVKGVANLTIDPNSISTRNNQRQAILEKVTKYKPDYNQQDFKESQNAAVRFGSGPQGNAVRSFNVALEHLETLKDAAAAMGSGDIQRINQIRNAWRRETGSDLPTNFEAVKQLLSAETVKAIVGGGTAGALADREEAARTMIARSSPSQIVGVIDQLQHLFGGQIHGLEQQYKAATKRNDFRERYLTPIGRRAAAAADADIGKTPDMRGVGGKSRTQSKEREFSGEQQPIPQFSKEEIDAEMKRRGLQ